jgi:hypothetical protein
MATTYPDRLSELKARLQAATSEPWACEPSPDGTEVYGLLIGRGGLAFHEDTASADINLIIDAPDDLRWAVQEIEFLRLYLKVLGDFALAADALRSALEEPARGRVERRRRAFDDARAELLAMPNWRPGECHNGCRRYATHELVIEQQDGSVERQPVCEECGAWWLETRRAVIDAGFPPAATFRLEPIARRGREAEGVRQ